MTRSTRTTIADRALFLGPILSCAIALSGCGRGPGVDSRPTVEVGEQSRADAPELIASQSRFGLETYRRLVEHDPKSNLVFAPTGLANTLAMVACGARGETARELASALSLPFPIERLPGAAAWSLRGVADVDPHHQLLAAQALWIQEGTPPRQDFKAMIQTCFGGSAQTVDFQADPGAATQAINEWAAGRTDGRITRLIEPESLSGQTHLVLTNAVAFRGVWQHPFPLAATKPASFFLLDGREVSVPMMRLEASLPCVETTSAQWVELPYRDGPWRLLLGIPRERGGLPGLESTLNAEEMAATISKLEQRKVTLTMPRLTLSSRIDGASLLRQSGVSVAFDPKKADFSGLADAATAREIALTGLFQQTQIVIDEEGTTAASVADARIEAKSAEPPGEPIEVRLDRPSLLLLRDGARGTIQFIVRVVDPSQAPIGEPERSTQ